MPRCIRAIVLAVFLILLLAAPALAADSAPAPVLPEVGLPEAYLALATRPGVTLPVLVIAPQHPRGAVILLAGGGGRLGITEQEGQGQVKNGGNFLVRTRQLFAARGLVVAVADAPSDRSDGMSAGFRFSAEHLEDLRTLAAHLRGAYGLKPWLVGTSMGTLSAAYGAGNLGPEELGGVVLTSTITKSAKRWDLPARRERAVLDAGLEAVRMPALVVRHKDDGCAFSAPEFGPRLLEGLAAAPRKKLLTFEGGLPAQSDACEAKAAHGYFGIEDEVVAAIAAFILDGAANGAKP